MDTFATVMDWVIIIVGILSIIVLGWIVMNVLHLKNQAMSSYKRLSERPLERARILARTGQGIAQQETVRVQHIGASAKRAAVSVKATVDSTRVVVEQLKDSDIEPLIERAQAFLKFATAAANVMKAASKQGAQTE